MSEPKHDHDHYASENRAIAKRLREDGLGALAAVFDATADLHETVAKGEQTIEDVVNNGKPFSAETMDAFRGNDLAKARAKVAVAVDAVQAARKEYRLYSPEFVEAERDELLIRPELEAADAARKAAQSEDA